MTIRIGRPPLPREHGAWAMLLTPPLLALLAEGPALPGLLAAAGWVAAYALRGPLEALTGKGASGRSGMAQAQPPVAWFWLFCFGLTALGLLGWAVWLQPAVLVLLLLAGSLLALVYWLAARGESRSLWAGLLAVAGLSAGGPLYYLAAAGAVPPAGWVLAYGSLAYFGGSVFRVKSVARERRQVGFRWFSVALHAGFVAGAGLAAWLGWAPTLLAVALMPPALFAAWGARRGGSGPAANLGTVGKIEMGLTLLFALLLLLGLRLS